MAVDAVAALALSGISKRFGSIIALDAVDFDVQPGHVHALLGENGAGKTTLMRVAAGLIQPDAGSMTLFGSRHGRLTARQARLAGVGMVQQHHSLAPNLTAAENIAVGERGLFHPRRAEDRLEQLMTSSGLRVTTAIPVGSLSIVERQRLEILKALARRARLLILDEPTPGLAPSEIQELLAWIRSFAQQGGAVVLVTHKLREARQVSDSITVLRRGRVVLRAATRAITDEQIATAMFPESAGSVAVPPVARVDAPTVARVSNLEVRDDSGVPRIVDANLQLGRGEIVGVAAVAGAGHADLLAVLAGLRVATRGVVERPDRVAVIPADRLRDAIIPDFSLVENVALRNAGQRRGMMQWPTLRDRASALVTRFGIAAASVSVRAGTLSGGNQQRLVAARELETPVDLVVADNPTRGLDLQAVQFVHAQLRTAAAHGAAVIVHSSDLDELFALAQRMVVVFHGTVREVAMEREAVGRAMIGA